MSTEAHNNDDPQLIQPTDTAHGYIPDIWPRPLVHDHPALLKEMQEGANADGLNVQVLEKPYDEQTQQGLFYGRVLLYVNLTVADETMHGEYADLRMYDNGRFMTRELIETMREIVRKYDKGQHR